jgi:quinol monooxygenase YgiN
LTVLCLDRYPVEPRSVADFERLLDELTAAMRRASGILWADTARATDDDPSYLVTSEWRRTADADAFDAGEAAASFRMGAEALLRGDVTTRRFRDP